MMSSFESPFRKTRVLVAEDNELMRNLLVELISASMDFRVIGAAANGYEAIRMVHELNPDIVTLDLEMPELGGLETLGYIMSEAPRPVVVVSSHVGDQAGPALKALDYGAVEIVAKPAGDSRDAVDVLGDRLLDALRAAAGARIGNLGTQRPVFQARKPAVPLKKGQARCAIGIAASTGGPRALSEIIPRLPADLPSAFLIVQHMPPGFTRPFAQRLDSLSAIPVKEAEDGELLRAGQAYVAPAGVHMTLRRTDEGIAVALGDGDAVWGVKPAADLLFRSLAEHFGPASGGVVLTGIGRDGSAGLRAIREVGGWTAVQDSATSVVYGMPRNASEHADDHLALSDMPDVIAAHSFIIARKRRR